jgi:hypothetical protein
MVLPYKFVAFRLLNEIEDAVKDVPTIVLDTTLLPVIVENKIVPLIEEPTSDEIVRVLPLSVENVKPTNPRRVDTMDVDATTVLPLSVETLTRFIFMVDTTELDTVTILPVMVE